MSFIVDNIESSFACQRGLHFFAGPKKTKQKKGPSFLLCPFMLTQKEPTEKGHFESHFLSE